MNKNSIITLVVLAGGGYLAYWYLTNYGPSGPAVVNGVKVAPSWWDSWFSGATATAATVATTPVAAGTGTGTTPITQTTGGGDNPLITAMAALPGYGALTTGLKAEALALVSAAGAVSGPTQNWFIIEASTGHPLSSAEQQAISSQVGTTTDVVSFVSAVNAVVNTPGGQAGGGGGAPQTSGTAGGVTTSAMLSKAGVSASTTMNADQWSYYYAQITGTALSAAQFSTAFPSLTATDRGSMTADQFLAALHSAGLSGIYGLGAQIRVPARSYSGVLPSGMSGGMGMSFSSSNPPRGFRSGRGGSKFGVQ